MPDAQTPPLAGVRIIESSLLGPAAITTHLADLGADVIQIEPPSGSPARAIGQRPRPPCARPGSARSW